VREREWNDYTARASSNHPRPPLPANAPPNHNTPRTTQHPPKPHNPKLTRGRHTPQRVRHLAGRQVGRQLLGGASRRPRERADGRVHMADIVRVAQMRGQRDGAEVVGGEEQEVDADGAAAGAR